MSRLEVGKWYELVGGSLVQIVEQTDYGWLGNDGQTYNELGDWVDMSVTPANAILRPVPEPLAKFDRDQMAWEIYRDCQVMPDAAYYHADKFLAEMAKQHEAKP